MDNKNREAQFLNIPTMKHERQYGFMDATFVNCGWAIATWCFLTGGLTANLVDFKTAIIAAFAGNLIGVAIMLFAEITTTVKYGEDTAHILYRYKYRMGGCLVCNVLKCGAEYIYGSYGSGNRTCFLYCRCYNSSVYNLVHGVQGAEDHTVAEQSSGAMSGVYNDSHDLGYIQ